MRAAWSTTGLSAGRGGKAGQRAADKHVRGGRHCARAGAVRPVLPVTAGDQRGAWVVTYLVEGEEGEFTDVLWTYVVVALVALLVVGLVGWFVAGALLAPLRTLRQTAHEISETDLSRRIPVAGDDEVAELARTFNAMLDRLESAFAAQRRFLDDAGHELRTPITIVRGHLELMGDDPAERERDDARW